MKPPPPANPPAGHSAAACETCPSRNTRVERLGVKMDNWDYVVALAGNPNTGKSTVFNTLTGLRQHTGNWPGKTISRAEGGFGYHGAKYKIVDLPGTYSLLSATPDEDVARNFILFGQPDVTVIVADATALERNLNLVLQILQITKAAVLCVNLMDEARAHGLEIDTRNLARDLGIPVVPCAARRGEGMDQLLKEMEAVAKREIRCQPYHLKLPIPGLQEALAQISGDLLQAFPNLPHAEWVALRLLEGDRQIMQAVSSGEIGSLLKDVHATVLDSPGGEK